MDESWREESRQFYREGQPDQALARVSAYLERAGEDADALGWRAHLQLCRDASATALGDVQRALRQRPEDAFLLALEARARLAESEREAGLRALARALKRAEDERDEGAAGPTESAVAATWAYLRCGDEPEEAERLSQRALAGRPAPEYAALASLVQGLLLEADEDSDEALELYSQAIAIDPGLPDGYFLRARLAAQVGGGQQAVAADEEEVLARGGPRLGAAVWAERARRAHAAEDDRQALAAWSAGLELLAGSPDLLQGRARARFALDDLEGARADYLAAQDAGAALTALDQYELASALYGLGEPEQARRALAGFLAARPADPDGWSLQGQLLVEAEDYDGAREAFQRALNLDPDQALAEVQLAVLEERAREPGPDSAADTLALAAQLLGRGAVRDDPALQARALWLRGQAYLRRGVPEAALRSFQEALRANPDDRLVQRAEARLARELQRR